MEKTEYMSHSEDVENKQPERRRSSLTAGDIKHGDRALDLIGDERVELTDEDVRLPFPALCLPLNASRTNESVERQTE